MTKTTTTDPEELVLLEEIQAIQDEIARTEQQMVDLERLHLEAVAAEGEAMQAVSDARAVSDPLIWASREDENQMAVYIGDTTWRLNYPQAAAAHGQTTSAQERLTQASARVIKLSKARDVLVWHRLPQLHGVLQAKQQELAQRRREQAQAVAQRQSTSHMDAFRRKLRGDK